MNRKLRKIRGLVTSVLIFALFCSVVGINPVNAKAESKYPYDYSIRNFLSDYQYVTRDNLTVSNHTMGGVICGGNCQIDAFGDAMVSPSYAKNIIKTGNMQVNANAGIPSGYKSNSFYYNTMQDGAVPSYMMDRFIKGTYVDIENAFTKLISQSQTIAAGASRPTVSGDEITLDFSKHSSYTISSSDLKKGHSTSLNIIGISSPDAFMDKEYSISFTGFHSNSLYLDYVWGSNTGYDYYVHILFNGNKFEQVMKQMGSANYSDGQFVNSGMKLITNLPDAQNVVANGLSGHLVAPCAKLNVLGGSFEGGIIAKETTATVEGHFYPYYKVGGARVSEPSSERKYIVKTELVKPVINVGEANQIKYISDNNLDDVMINNTNATYQWQVYDENTNVWVNIAGACQTSYTPDDSKEGKQIRCYVTGQNDYSGSASASCVVRTKPPVSVKQTDTTITIVAESDFEYELRDPDGKIVTSWVQDGNKEDGDSSDGTVTFVGLDPNTEYEVVKRVPGEPDTESYETTITTAIPQPTTNPQTTPSQSAAPGITEAPSQSVAPGITEAPEQSMIPATTATPQQSMTPGITTAPQQSVAPGVTAAPETSSTPSSTDNPGSETLPEPGTAPATTGTPIVTIAPSTSEVPVVSTSPSTSLSSTTTTSGSETTSQITAPPATSLPIVTPIVAPEDQTVKPGSIELKIPTIVMKKIMAPNMKFRIKLMNLKGAKVTCSSSNKKIATIDKKGLVKTGKKLGKATLVINVTKGKHKIQYIVHLVMRKSLKKNYSLYKYKTSYKYPTVCLYKLIPMGKTYQIKLKHLNKTAKVKYQSNKPSVAKVNSKGKVTPLKSGRADVAITVTQNGLTYKYFVIVRATKSGVESNTSYLRVIR